MTPSARSRRSGFTLIDIIVVVGVLLILLALLIPAVQRVREAAARTQSMNNLKQMGLAMHNFASVYNGTLPPGVGEFGKKTGTFHYQILPFIEQQALYNKATDAVWDNEVWSVAIPLYLDPRDGSGPPNSVYQGWLATTNYVANAMVFQEDQARYKIGDIPDGTSNTLACTTRNQMCSGAPTAWGYPSMYTWAPLTAYYNQSLPQFSLQNEECDPTRPQALGFLLAGICDGSVRGFSPRISATTWFYFCCPDDGNALGADFN
jgi:type II secretory pathway pseudopilin PulG